MMSPSETAFLLDIDEETLKDDIATPGHPARVAYMRGLATTAYDLRRDILDLAKAGSPNAINESNHQLLNAINQLAL